jgi:hypothetical protein
MAEGRVNRVSVVGVGPRVATGGGGACEKSRAGLAAPVPEKGQRSWGSARADGSK